MVIRSQPLVTGSHQPQLVQSLWFHRVVWHCQILIFFKIGHLATKRKTWKCIFLFFLGLCCINFLNNINPAFQKQFAVVVSVTWDHAFRNICVELRILIFDLPFVLVKARESRFWINLCKGYDFRGQSDTQCRASHHIPSLIPYHSWQLKNIICLDNWF